MVTRALLLVALASFSSAAAAQDSTGQGVVNAGSVPANISVADRPRPEYSPIGGRLGSFFLYPSLDISAQYTSNLRATSTNALSEFTALVRPAATLQSQWGRHALSANAYYLHAIHARTTSEDYSNYGIGAAGRLDATNDTVVRLDTSYDKLTEPRTDFNSISVSRSPLSYDSLRIGGSISQSFVSLSVVASGGVTKQKFDDAVLLNGATVDLGFRNNTRASAAIEARQRIGSGATAIVHLERDQIDYDINPIGGVDRNSHSYRAELGVGLAVSRLIFGDVRFGYFKQKNDDPRFFDSSGASFSINLLYSLSTLTSIQFFGDRTVEPGGSTVTAGNVRSTGAITVDHELFRNLVLTGSGRYSHVSPQGPLAGVDEYVLRGGARYYANRRWRASVDINHYRRRSSILPSVDVTTATATFTVML